MAKPDLERLVQSANDLNLLEGIKFGPGIYNDYMNYKAYVANRTDLPEKDRRLRIKTSRRDLTSFDLFVGLDKEKEKTTVIEETSANLGDVARALNQNQGIKMASIFNTEAIKYMQALERGEREDLYGVICYKKPAKGKLTPTQEALNYSLGGLSKDELAESVTHEMRMVQTRFIQENLMSPKGGKGKDRNNLIYNAAKAGAYFAGQINAITNPEQKQELLLHLGLAYAQQRVEEEKAKAKPKK